MASGFMNMLSYWFFFLSSIVMFTSLFLGNRPGLGRLDDLPAVDRPCRRPFPAPARA
ncbi:MAG: hypothetical protein WKG07_29385 [Hymenobacter sp.]